MKKKELPQYPWAEVKGKIGVVKHFGKWHYKGGKKSVLCQVKGCGEKANWLVELPRGKGKGVVLCFAHGEDARPTKSGE